MRAVSRRDVLPPPRVVATGLALRRMLLRAADALLPANAVLWDRTMGVARTQVVGTIAELGVADVLAFGPLTAGEIAPRVGADPDALHRVLRLAASEGILTLDGRGRFGLTRVGRALRSDAASSMRPWARYAALRSTGAAWEDLTETVRTGRSAFPRVHGMSVWDWFNEHPDEGRLFAGAMRTVTEIDAPAIAASDLWPRSGTVCDVAGGAGTLLGEILATHPALRGVLVEAAVVLTEAEAHLARRGLRDRAELVEGDLFGGFSAQADVFVLKNIVHDWDDATSAKILANVRATMAPGQRLLVIEQLQERNDPHQFTSLTDLLMLTQCDDGRERSRAELRDLLTGAGFSPGRIAPTGVSAIVEGVAV